MTEIKYVLAREQRYPDGTTSRSEYQFNGEVCRYVHGQEFSEGISFPRKWLDPSSEVKHPGDWGTLRYDGGEHGEQFKKEVLRHLAAKVRWWLKRKGD